MPAGSCTHRGFSITSTLYTVAGSAGMALDALKRDKRGWGILTLTATRRTSVYGYRDNGREGVYRLLPLQ